MSVGTASRKQQPRSRKPQAASRKPQESLPPPTACKPTHNTMIKLVTLLLSATGAVAVPRHPDAPILDLPDDDNIAGSSSSLLADFTRRTKLTLQSPEQHASAFNSRHHDEASLSTIHGQDKRFDPTTPEVCLLPTQQGNV